MQNYQTQAELDAWDARYGAGFSQYLANQIETASFQKIDLLDVKELNDLVVEYRSRIRSLIALYRSAQQNSKKNGSYTYRAKETLFLRRQIAELRNLYQMALIDSRKLMDEYMRRLQGPFTYTTLYKAA